MNWVDWAALGLVAVAALLGARRGLLGSALSTLGICAGAVLGARAAPSLLPGSDTSPYTPLIALGGAVVGAVLLEGVGAILGSAIRRSIRLTPLRLVDSGGGFLFGAAAGLVLAWTLGAVALHLPRQTELRRDVQRSVVLGELNEVVPPARLMDALARVDPFPAIAGPAAPVEPPDPTVLRRPGVREAAPSVVRVTGSACGLAVTGSGWVARRGLVVTAAHVVVGQSDTRVESQAGERLRADAVAFDPRNDVAVLRVPDLAAPPLELGEPEPGEPVAILGYPEGGGLTAEPGRIGRTTAVLSRDAYGRGPVLRTVTSLGGKVRRGNSGGPAVNARGEVETTVFAARIGSDGGFGVPPGVVRRVLEGADEPVSTGDCAR